MISLTLNETAGVVLTVACGSTDRAEIEAYLLELADVMEQARARWGRCLHLVDAGRLSVRSDRNLCCLAGAGVELQELDDRAAVVMKSPRAIAHLDHMPSQFRTMVFRDRQSALDWLAAANAGEVEMLQN